MAKKAPKIRAQFIPTRVGGHYIIQCQHRFLWFTWWETMKRGDNGIWNYGDAKFTKEEVDEFFKQYEAYWERGGKFETYKEQ